jgi:FAD/FMN-containing dehydrogenase
MAEKEELVKIVGAENVLDSPEILEEHSRDMSFVLPIRPRCVVKPKSKAPEEVGWGEKTSERVQEVQELVKWANDTLTPLVPISSGPPHFRGDTVPSAGGAAIVDLSGWKRILRMDRRNRVVMVEPGITFAELIPEVGKEGMRLIMPLCPRSTKSVVGSILEREPVILPKYHWENLDPLLCTEIVWGNGEYFRTGAAGGQGTLEEQWAAGGAQKSPMGPSQVDYVRLIQGSQGTMGIVTWATMKCELAPAITRPFLVGADRIEDLFDFIHWMLRLRIAEECFVLNNSNLAAILTTKPEDYERLREDLPPWVLFFAIEGFEYFPEERVEYLLEEMKDIAKRTAVIPTGGVPGVTAGELLRTVRKPSAEPYWKLRYKGSCQDIFFLTQSDRISEHIRVMYDEADRHGYPSQDIGIYLQPIRQGCGWHCEFNLPFDPNSSREVARMRKLFPEASTRLMDSKAFFSRPYGPWADMAYRRDGETTTLLKKVKGMFDPNNVMNPGKLCF